jgi:hypothetical protein
MYFNRLAVLALVAGMAAVPALAAPVTYVCKLDRGKSGTFLPPQIVLLHDPATGAVVVNDEVIVVFNGQPLAGVVKTDNAKRITFGWDVTQTADSGGRRVQKMQYRATVQKADRRLSVSVKPLGFSNSFESRGACVVK